MMFIIVVLVSLLLPYGIDAMFGSRSLVTAGSTVTWYKPSASECAQHTKTQTTPACTVEIHDYALPEKVQHALNENHVNAIKSYFLHVPDYVKNRKQLSQALMILAKKRPNQDPELLNFILSEINAARIENVECLISHAARNGHTRILDFVRRNLSQDVFLLPVFNAIAQNDIDTFETLLSGIDANHRPSCRTAQSFIFQAIEYGRPECVRALVTRKVYVLEHNRQLTTPLMQAFVVYAQHAAKKSNQLECRLAVIQELFKGIPSDQVDKELAWHLDFVPEEFHATIAKAVNQTLVPAQLYMNEREQLQEYKERDQKVGAFLNVCCKGCVLSQGMAYCLWAGLCRKRN